MKTIRWEQLLMPIVAVVLGVYLLMHPWAATNALCRLIGWLVLLAGVGSVLNAILYRRGNSMFVQLLLVGILAIGIGAFIANRPWALTGIVNILICLFLLAEGGMNVQSAFVRKNFGDQLWWIPLVVGSVCVVIGLFAMFTPWATNTMMRLVGLFLLFGGASGLLVSLLGGEG